MRAKDIQIGSVYTAKVSNRIVPVRIDRKADMPLKGWWGYNLATNRRILIQNAARLRGPA